MQYKITGRQAGDDLPGLFACQKPAFVHSAHKPCHVGAIFDAIFVPNFVPVFVQKTCHVYAVFCACFCAKNVQKTCHGVLQKSRLSYRHHQGGEVVTLSDVVLVAIVGAIGSGLCSILGVLASSKLTQYRLEQLEKKVQAHNNLVARMYAVEHEQNMLKQHIEDLHRNDE